MTRPAALTEYRITGHAREEMDRRQISEAEVARGLSEPAQSESARDGREVYQARLEIGEPPQTYLLRVLVDVDRQPPEVATVYRTSKISKYWRTEP